MSKLLLFSASGYEQSPYLSHTKEIIFDFFQSYGLDKEAILFIPYAGVRLSYDEYEAKVKKALEPLNIHSIHHASNPKEAILKSKAFITGGGNSFMLLHKLYELDLLDTLRQSILNGNAYVGWSAGSNIAGKSIATTNDMPIVMPKSFEALGVFTHHINPHFISGKIPNHNGESREERLEEFLIAHPKESIYALPEGCGLRVQDGEFKVVGFKDALKLTHPMQIQNLKLHQNYSL